MVPFSVSVLHHRYWSLFFLTGFSLHILQGNLDVLWYDSHTLGMYGVEMRWYHFLLCFPFVSSPQTLQETTCYHIAVFHFFFHYLFPTLPFIPIFIDLISCFSYLNQHGNHFTLINLWSLGSSPSRQ